MHHFIKSMIKNKKGLTLIEVIIVMALISIISIPLLQMLSTGQSVFKQNKEALDRKTIALAIEEYIKEEIQFARSLEVTDEEDFSETYLREMKEDLNKKGEKYEDYRQFCLYVNEENELILQEQGGLARTIFNKHYLNKKTLALEVTGNGQVVVLKVIVDGYSVNTTIKINNLGNLGVGQKEGSDHDKLIFLK